MVKLYVREPGTERLMPLVAPASQNRIAILTLAQVEFRSAVRKRERDGEIPAQVATQLLDLFQRHVNATFLTQAVNDFVLDRASLLVDHYALRAYDAIQLGGYLALRNASGNDIPIFVCSDKELVAAAANEGIPVFDPCLPT